MTTIVNLSFPRERKKTILFCPPLSCFACSECPPSEDKIYDLPSDDEDENAEKIYEDLTGILRLKVHLSVAFLLYRRLLGDGVKKSQLTDLGVVYMYIYIYIYITHLSKEHINQMKCVYASFVFPGSVCLYTVLPWLLI